MKRYSEHFINVNTNIRLKLRNNEYNDARPLGYKYVSIKYKLVI